MNTTAATTVKVSPEVQARRDAATIAFKEKMHRMWHQVRGMEPCAKMACEHAWYPA